MTFKRILIAVDESPIAARAADVGSELGRSLKAEVAFVHVIQPPLNPPMETLVTSEQLIAQASLEARKLLHKFGQQGPGHRASLEFVRVGKSSAEILAAAKEWSDDLVVIGSHGKGVVQRVMLGSVAESVMRHARCPVLIVRPPE
jgi:nucleotide-binding universal stress UspA family protein